ncbi:MAG: MFS transporter [Pelagibacteraceae bacterium]|jgi:MFS family permease|nr:MFS transporter [Pelagibacteraceae bacterium]MBO6467517.1 MFS transporter [Pelagibacteraceae bacterium]MBO6480034.1 MFS transporter [Pelagibacteraceae bacterium]HJO13533.1 MFS transporter [Alphaproteobacteria bacterium]|tara:strand:- start:455 stop:1642 length:1188 start_codon:yes stop_codon:yes gene_type:complete
MFSKVINYIDFKSINPSVKYLSIAAFFTGIALGYFFTVIVIVAKYKGFSEGTIGIIAACFSFGLMSAGFIVSIVLDKIGLYITMLLAITIQTVCVILMFVFFNPINLAINHFIMGVLAGMNWMTMDTWVNLVSDNKNRGKAIGFYNSAITVGFAAGPLLVGLFGTQGFFPIILCIVLMIIRSPVIVLIKKHIQNVLIPKLETKLNFSFIKIAPFIFLAIFVGGVNDSTFGALFPAYMINELFSDKQIGYLFFFGLFGGVISQPFIGTLADTIDKRKFIIVLLVFHLIWPILLHNYTIGLPLLFLSVLLWGTASVSLYTVTLAYLGERINIAELSIATSVFIIVYESGEFLGPAIIGSVMDYAGNIGFIYSLIIFTFFSLLVGIIRSFIRKGTYGI